MQIVNPSVFLIGETTLVSEGMRQYLEHIDTNWSPKEDAWSGAELIPEITGRICYPSWPGMNPNVTKIREGNYEYLKNIKAQKHGSVFEHSTFNLIFADVSRVFTHELITHRVGTAKSQESLRYVRLDRINAYYPLAFHEDDYVMTIFSNTIENLEKIQNELSKHFDLDNETSFERKKHLTSAMRRLAPDGVATTVGWSVNARSLYNIIQRRTHPSAEEEIRVVLWSSC